jgi:hypothetical protein
MPVYMVDRNLNGISMDALAAAQRSAIDTAATMRADGADIRYLRSTFVPGSGRCLCLFEASDEQAVERLNKSASLPFEQITEALDLPAPA